MPVIPGKNKVNYQKILEETLAEHAKKEEVPTLLLHSCCAPCSSYVLEYLSEHFKITVLYYNPNISPREEFSKRIEEQMRLIRALPAKYPVQFVATDYHPDEFFEIARGYETVPEGGARCERCYRLRLEYTAKFAAAEQYDYFTTTLSISPMKNAEKLNEIGAELARQYGVDYLYSDFKKKNGYARSVELSKEYQLYRQDYCGCIYSKRQREKELAEQGKERGET